MLKSAMLLVPMCVLAGADVASARQACEKLAEMHLPSATITSAVMIPEGPYSRPVGPGNAPAQGITLPSRCEVTGVIPFAVPGAQTTLLLIAT